MTLSATTLFNQAWESIKALLPLVAGLTLIYLIGVFSFAMVPFLGGFLTGPFTAGYMVCLLRITRNQEISYKDVFWGFLNLNRFAHLLTLGLLHAILVGLGLILFIIPGVWFVIASWFSTTYFVLGEHDAVTAIKKSLASVKGHWFEVFGLLCFTGLLLLTGAACFLLGLLVAIPITTLMFILAAENLDQTPAPLLNQESTLLNRSSVMSVNPS